VAPSHGLIWRKNPKEIILLYKKWAELAGKPGKPGITLVYGSMYGNTEKIMNAVAHGVNETGLPIDIFNVPATNISYIMSCIWERSGVIIGSPTYEVGLFPPMVMALEILAIKKIENKKAAYFGSYGWSGGALKKIKSIIEPLKWDITDTLEFQGGASEKVIKEGYELGKKFALSLKQ
jgi:flavorubredoxin